jgi:uncharacterized membrane protein (UPF0127 family)
MRKCTPFIFIFVLAIVCLIWASPDAKQLMTITFPTSSLTIVTHSKKLNFNVEVARTEEQERLGLMFRKSLDERHGMIFDFGIPRHIEMWMKNTLITLDMVFIDNNNTIACIAENTKVESTDIITCDKDARFVLEVAGGTAKRYHIAKGDKVIYSPLP